MLQDKGFWHVDCYYFEVVNELTGEHELKKKYFLTMFLIVCALMLMLCPRFAHARGGGRGTSGSGSVAVHGYTRSNGTYVSSHFRSAPSGLRANTWGYSDIGKQQWPGMSLRYGQTNLGGGMYQSGYPIVERSQGARMSFLRSHGYRRLPSGYEIDHIRPLSQGGADTPENMQLLTKEQHHLKTARERHKD